ncbi:MAG: BREX-1 system adenine-specific DNA-methyltransferase PglX [Acidimicrobiia bacterium]|nr:BREX-1 system adenine-specific DNA-methyltransferase PglX [Acidimicrobiia bacterium]
MFHITLNDLHAVPGSPVAYWMSPSIRRLFTDHPPLEGHGAEARQGLATGDDFRFVRAFWEIDPSRIARTREETKAGKRWVPFAKGGEYSPYWADIHLVVNFENDGDSLRQYDGSVIRNPQYYFRSGLTWPERTTSGFGPRVLPAGGVFSHVGHGAFPLVESGAVLGLLTSRVCDALLAASLGSAESTTSGSPAKRYSVGSVQRLPWMPALAEEPRVAELALQIAEIRRRADLSDETSRLFQAPAVVLHLSQSDGLGAAAMTQSDLSGTRHLEALELSYELERRLHELALLDSEAEQYLDDEVGRHPLAYGEGSLDESELRRYLTQSIDDVIDELIERGGGSRAIANLTFVADRRLEVIAHGLHRSPRQIEAFRRDQRILPYGEPAASAADVLSYLVGVAVGRWDIRAAGVEPALGDLLDPVPIHPPGLLLDEGRPARSTPTNYSLSLPSGQMLFDQPGHPWDIVERLHAAAGALVVHGDRLLADLMKHLKGNDPRDHFRKHFFKDHLSRYSKSRRKAPIYWPLQVPSGSWGVWVYAPAFTRETIFAVESAATARLNASESEIGRLRRDQQNGGGGRSSRELAAAMEAEERLAEELRLFAREAGRIAALGWEPDLDDGIILCAAPLAYLFPAWKDLTKERKNIKAGKYPWATVSKWADEL